MKKFLNEFKTFISRGNVMDMAIGVVIATAFGKIKCKSCRGYHYAAHRLSDRRRRSGDASISRFKPAVVDGETVVSEAVVLGLGTFLTTIIDFLLIAFVVFLVVKAMNMAKTKLEKPAEPEPEKEPEPTKEEQLLSEIRDLLKNK
ncbi:MAG: MscL family protein [Acutalibacteraceae bacterium]